MYTQMLAKCTVHNDTVAIAVLSLLPTPPRTIFQRFWRDQIAPHQLLSAYSPTKAKKILNAFPP